MRDCCPICHRFISDWEDATGKISKVENTRLHTSCLQDFLLKHGEWSIKEVVKRLGGG